MADLISAAQAAKEAGVNRQYILNLIHEEIIKGQLVANAYVIDHESFDAWLAKRRQRQQAEQGDQGRESDQDEPEHAEASAGAKRKPGPKGYFTRTDQGGAG